MDCEHRNTIALIHTQTHTHNIHIQIQKDSFTFIVLYTIGWNKYNIHKSQSNTIAAYYAYMCYGYESDMSMYVCVCVCASVASIMCRTLSTHTHIHRYNFVHLLVIFFLLFFLLLLARAEWGMRTIINTAFETLETNKKLLEKLRNIKSAENFLFFCAIFTQNQCGNMEKNLLIG